ncbi:MAG: type II toxin-antitoxin system death-on-curing family toxin [Dehalococcoidia bacterium]|nr:type II toxin-antitoxin system death-on-curing family toxin [Dehalococcoidia bacterium]
MRSIVEAVAIDLFPDLPASHVAGDRGDALLESALAQPRWPHYRTAQDRTAQAKAAPLHYSLNKNHTYIDSNKRLAVTAMEWFLLRNGLRLHVSNDELVAFALAVSSNAMSRAESERWVANHANHESWTAARHLSWQESRATTVATP